MRQMITRIYSHYASADQAIRNLRAAGLPGSAISILASDSQGWHEPGGANVDPRHDKDRDGRDDRAQGALTGGTIGVVAGAALGLALGFGVIAMPGVDRVIAAAWYAPIFIGAVLLGTLGGLIGALVESRVSRENAALYTEALRRGGALVTARVKKNEVEIYSVIMDTSAVDAEQRVVDPLVANDPTLSGISPGEIRARRGGDYDLGKTG